MDLVCPSKKRLPFYKSEEETFYETKHGKIKTSEICEIEI